MSEFIMTVKNPPEDEEREWVHSQLPTYAQAVQFLALFMEKRAGMSDEHGTQEQFEELRLNISRAMVKGFDAFGTQ